MKKFIKKILVIIAIFMAAVATTNLTPTPVYADCRDFLGMPSWDCGIVDETDLGNNVWLIASNIFTDITIAASYLVLGFVIYGGYLYMFSGGDPGKVAAGKRTLTNAFIGLAIVLLAGIIINSIRVAFINDSMTKCIANIQDINNINIDQCTSPNTVVSNALGWIFGVTGIVAVIFIIIGGIGYVTSAGDPTKAQKSRKTLIYALIGLAIVGLSSIITAFVTNIINNSQKPTGTSLIINETTIAKEVKYEK